MELDQFLHHLNEGESVEAGSSEHHMMMHLSQEALKMTMALNNTYHTPEEIRIIIAKLTEKPIDETFNLFPPFYTDCGKNLHIGKMFLLIQVVGFKIKAVSQLVMGL